MLLSKVGILLSKAGILLSKEVMPLSPATLPLIKEAMPPSLSKATLNRVTLLSQWPFSLSSCNPAIPLPQQMWLLCQVAVNASTSGSTLAAQQLLHGSFACSLVSAAHSASAPRGGAESAARNNKSADRIPACLFQCHRNQHLYISLSHPRIPLRFSDRFPIDSH